MEHIKVSNMMDYFDTHNILCPQQHGFRSNIVVRLNSSASRNSRKFRSRSAN